MYLLVPRWQASRCKKRTTRLSLGDGTDSPEGGKTVITRRLITTYDDLRRLYWSSAVTGHLALDIRHYPEKLPSRICAP